MSSDEATAKRQRVSRACDLCRKKKIKCDGDSPLCGNCKAFSLNCSYKDTTKKRGPPKGYIEAIENRLYKLENYLKNVAEEETDPRTIELLKELQAPLETPEGEQIKGKPQRRQRRRPVNQESKTHPTMNSPLSTLLNSPDLSHNEVLPEESAKASSVTTAPTTIVSSPTRDDSTGQLSMDENGQVRYLGKSSGFYLLSDSRTYQNGAFHFSGYAHKLQQQQKEQQHQLQQHPKNCKTSNQRSINPLELPPKDLSEHLIQLYLTHFYPVLPLFFKKRLACPLSPLEPISPLLLNAIYAMAARVSSDERVRSDPNSPDTAGDIFYERARCLLDDYYDTPKISTVQALLLMASHQMGAMKAARAWLYSGMAFRMAQDLGLNRNCDHWNISPEERERRKRVFWCCFIVDRIISAIYGRSSNFEERDCDVPFPTVEDDEPIPIASDSSNSNRSPAGVLEVFTQSIKIAGILGHVLKNIYYAKAKLHTDSQHIDHILTTLHQQLIHWHRNLPESLQYKLPNTQIGEKGPDPPSAICQLHLMYYTTVILLHRSFIPGPTQTQLPTSLPSYKLCESAATSVLDIVNIMLGENHLRYVYNFSVFFVFTAGIIFIKLASSKEASKAFDAKINCNRIMRALDDLEMTWMNAARGCNILGELAGLRDIKLECDKYVPRKDAESTPPRCIAVPNSPETMNEDETHFENWDTTKSMTSTMTVSQPPQRSASADNFSNDFPSSSSVFATPSQVPISSVRHHQNRSASIDQLQLQEQRQRTASYFEQQANNTNPTMDPFEAPGIIHTSSTSTAEEFDPLSTAFWGMPTSLDTDEWNAYFGTQQNQNQQPCEQVPQQSQQLTNLLLSTNQSLHQASSFIFNRSQQLHLPSSPSQSALFGFLDDNHDNSSHNEQQQVFVSSPGSMINEQHKQQQHQQQQQQHQQNQQQQQQQQQQQHQITSTPSSTDVLYW